MLAAMDADLTTNRSIILQGALNHTPDGPEYQRWVEAGLRDAFAAKGTGDGFSIPSTEPRKKIDYVWAHGPLADRLTECSVLFEGDFRRKPYKTPVLFFFTGVMPIEAQSFGSGTPGLASL